MVEEFFGLSVPFWLSQHFPEWNTFLTIYVSALWGLTSFPNESYPFNLQQELTKISGGSTIAEIVDRLILKIECQKSQDSECKYMKDQKFYAYSGHDLTEIGLFAALGFKNFPTENQLWPDLGSSIVLELWESEEAVGTNTNSNTNNQFEYYYAKIYYYQNSTVESPKNIGNLLPECHGKGCPISYLIKRAELLRPKPDLKI
uniref:2-phosphoxylose phosphatase 1 n=1 Tax=Panagrolaimus superbus TaxID=310955 RepID=A0A914YR73_9BILA